MKRLMAFAFVGILIAGMAFAQSPIDEPVAKVKLIRLEVLSLRQIRAEIEKIESKMGKKLTLDERKQYVDGKIDIILFLQMCERDGITVSETDINAQMSRMEDTLKKSIEAKQLPVGSTLQDLFWKNGIPVFDVRTYIKQQLLFQLYLTTKRAADFASLQMPTSEEIFSYYDLYKTQFIKPDSVRVSVVYIRTQGMAADAKAKAYELIKTLYAKAKSSTDAFDEVLVRAGDASSGYQANSQVVILKLPQYQEIYGQVFIETVFKLRVGEISGIIENEAGYQFVRVNEISPQKQLGLTDMIEGSSGTVEMYIRTLLYNKKKVDLLDSIQKALLADLRKQAVIETFYDKLTF